MLSVFILEDYVCSDTSVYEMTVVNTVKYERLDKHNKLECSRKYYNEISLLFGSVSLAVYLVTIYPSLPGGDSGELIVAAHELGVAHPPGYPLYTLVSWLFIKLLPFGNVAWRVGVQTAVCAGISTYCLSMVVLRLTDSLPCAVFAVGIWSWSRLTWIWSITAEVFAVNNLFVALLMFLGVYFEDQHDKDKLAKILDTFLLCKIGLCFVVGLVPYIYIPISSIFLKSRWTWGKRPNWTRIIIFSVSYLQTDKEMVISGVLIHVNPVERFWLQSDIVIVVIATATLCDIFKWLKSRVEAIEAFNLETVFTILIAVYQLQRNYLLCDQSRNTVVYDFGKEILRSMPPDAIVLTKGDLPSNVLRYLYLCENVRNDIQIFDQEVLTYEWAVPMLSAASPKIKFPGDYLHPKNTLMPDGKHSFSFKRFLDVNYDKYPIYGCIGGQDHDASWKTSYELLPFGPCYQFIKKGMLLNVPLYVNQTSKIASNWRYPYDGYDQTSWERVATNEMWNAQISSGYFLYEVAEISQNKEDKSNFIIHSYKLYTAAIERHKTVPSHWHKNYALVCERMLRANHDMDKSKLLSKSVYHFEKFLKLEPNDPDSKEIRNAIEMLKKHIRLIQQ
ncbi:hypothetical protein KUTeg_014051 [Tegillarca granosa]|uniref:Transmembrane protein 260 n=1 Tax=Tegillarca granosa TaxID=220873 RepID=A0ABQ9EZY8_TEGGR|nr:hypothetical protein KUTeg_014051 [Tegillarca granosa]